MSRQLLLLHLKGMSRSEEKQIVEMLTVVPIVMVKKRMEANKMIGRQLECPTEGFCMQYPHFLQCGKHLYCRIENKDPQRL